MGLFDIFKKKKTPAVIEEPEKLFVEKAEKIVKRMEEMSKKCAYKLTVDTSRKPTLSDTKFGGTPYWDLSREYPVSSKGEKLLLLAQINLSDVRDCGKLPDKGLLQFFIGMDDVYGMDFDNYISNDTFRVVYHESIDEGVTEESVLALGIPTSVNQADDGDFLFPMTGELAVNIAKTEVSVGTEDFEYDKFMHKAAEELEIKILDDETFFCILPEEVSDKEFDAQRNTGHWLFGYAYFTQNDPREYMTDLQDYVLLFQMDSDFAGGKPYEILWGDSGVGNFFIKLEDLRKLDFSKVMYNWDCC